MINKHQDTWYTNEEGFKFQNEPIEDSLSIEKTNSGYIARYLVQDEDPQSPENDDGIILVHYHRDCWIEAKDVVSKDEIAAWYHGEKIKQEKEYHIFPVAAYIHSGVVLSVGDGGCFPDQRWDVSHVGAILVSKKEFRMRKSALEIAESQIKWWNQYLSGDAYGCIKETYANNKKPLDLDSCWGYYGYEDAKKELKNF
jgi:hypothetical protein